ncbi:MAG: T9SS type A sorting domain-containing protein [Labilibaculum sp.]|nr:T9SS type A sorting domain-containing protein [Labilibaculum sp.]
MKDLFCILFSLLICIAFKVSAQESVTFDTGNLKEGIIDPGAGSMNLCWLLDSDIERVRTNSMSQRISEMKCGSLRFPYGHLADNYLWDTPPYGGTLEPKVASQSVIPGTWTWGTNADGTFKKDMDFDEFMGLCNSLNIEPLVVVNCLSYKFANSSTYEELKTTAVEWVKYAKSKGYKVAFWQIGNEMDHHQDILTQSEYVSLYKDFVGAMKAEDPAIKCGPGILSSTSYFSNLISQAPDKVDFTSCHQYLFGKPWKNYTQWMEASISGITGNIYGMQSAVNSSSKPDLPILVTESNAYGNWENTVNTALYKGLAWFDLLFTEQQYEDVKYTYMWNSHSPWGGENAEEFVANAWFNNDDNNLTSMGWPLYILNNTAEEKYMIPSSKVNGYTHSYGTYTSSTGNMTIYLMNKGQSSVTMDVILNNYTPDTTYERWVWSGVDPWDKYPAYQQTGTISSTVDGFSTSLPPHSLVVVKLTGSPETSALPAYFFDNLGINKRMKSNQADNDVELVAATEEGWRGKWELVSAGNGYYYIVCGANNMRLRGINSNIDDPGSVHLVDDTYTGDWVQWQLTKVNTTYFIDNIGHNVRLNATGDGQVAFGSKNWTGDWVQWKLTDSSTGLLKSGKITTGIEANTFDITEEVSGVLQIYPNPISAESKIKYQIIEDSYIILKLHNIQGKVIAVLQNGFQQKGMYTNFFDVAKLPHGMFFVKLAVAPKNGNKPFVSTEKIVYQ